jgi:hypothetical protein
MATLTERMVGAAQLDVGTFEEVEHDTNATGQALVVVVVSSVAAGIGASGGRPGTLLTATLAAIVGWLVWAALVYVVGTKVMPDPQTRGDMGELLRTIGFAQSPGVLRVLGIIPFVGWLISFAVGVWILIATVVAVRQALDYTSTGKAVVVCLIGFIVYWIIYLVFVVPAAILNAILT